MHIFSEKTLPLWKAGSKMCTAFTSGLNDNIRIAPKFIDYYGLLHLLLPKPNPT